MKRHHLFQGQSFLAVLLLFLISHQSLAQPANDNCANAIGLSVGSTCVTGVNSLTGQTLSAATVEGTGLTSSCGTSNSQDVWYKFVAQSVRPTIAFSNLGSSWSNHLRVQVLSGSCGSFTEKQCASKTTTTGTTFSFSLSSDLTLGSTYYIRIYKDNTTAPTGSTWGFDICITSTTLSRMREVFKQTIISNTNAINTPWEITYGPDGYLWVTGSKDYKAYRINPNNPSDKTTILDLSYTSTDFPAYKVEFNNATQNPWPQGGFAGLAIHPQFNSDPNKRWVYISYSKKYNGGSKGPGWFFTNSLVRFTYNTSTGKLENPVTICDTLPGSSDHNSQRIIIAPVNGADYLFYAQGDMGAGQLDNATRVNKAQNMASYEGKILRFNLEPDGDESGAEWIPDDNPYDFNDHTNAIWCVGIRNNQGFAYNPSTGVLYGSSHGPYSDDEINIIEKAKNYGHPVVIGYAADANYNGASAGVPNNGASSLSVISDEVAAAAAIPNYKDPLFSGYPAGGTGYPNEAKTVATIWGAASTPGNGKWPSEAWSGIDVYTNSFIPGWKNSLLVAGLKWGRVLRLKLDNTGTSIVQTNGADTIAYWQGPSRYRDIAFAPNGKDIYVSIDGTGTASGPGGTAPPASVAKCDNCIIKYTFLGYADAGGKSTIPGAIDVTEAPVSNTITNATTVTIDATNNNLWVPITGPDGNILAEIKANGNNLGEVTSAFYEKSGTTNRIRSGVHYLNRNMTITPQTQPATPVDIRLYISKAEFNALKNDPVGGISAITDLKILKNSDPAGAAIASNTTLIDPVYKEAHGANGYVLQATINSFSSFYFAGSNIILPLDLLSFKGSLQNNATLLQWETANETNTSQFEIERSTDAHNFLRIGTVTAGGNTTSIVNYRFIDYDVLQQSSSVVYYRLKITDKDGAYKYSDAIKITLPFSSGRVNLFPNPANEEVNVVIDAAKEGKVQWKLLDNTGRIMLQSKESLKKGSNSFSVSISKLSAGVYYFVIAGAGVDQQIKLQKL